MCMCVWCGMQGKCQLTKALRYHDALWVLSLFGVTFDSILYSVTIWSLSLEVFILGVCLCACICVFARV